MAEDIDIKSFFEEYGNELINSIKEVIKEKRYPYAPGKFGNAYSQGRNSAFKGEGPINALGGLLESVSGEYNPNDEAFYIYMASYWRIVNDGRDPGDEKYITRTSKSGKQWKQKLYTKMLPPGVLDAWISKRFGISDPKQLKSAGFGISYNIAKYGIRPTDFYEDASIKLEDLIAEAFPEKADDLIGLFFDSLVKKIKQ